MYIDTTKPKIAYPRMNIRMTHTEAGAYGSSLFGLGFFLALGQNNYCGGRNLEKTNSLIKWIDIISKTIASPIKAPSVNTKMPKNKRADRTGEEHTCPKGFFDNWQCIVSRNHCSNTGNVCNNCTGRDKISNQRNNRSNSAPSCLPASQRDISCHYSNGPSNLNTPTNLSNESE